MRLGVELDILSLAFRDCVVFKIRYSDVVFAAMYIPPRNSVYYDEVYFKKCELLMDHYENRHLIITGDLNSRIGTVANSNYMTNPDPTINPNGKKLREILERNQNVIVLNGFHKGILQ